MSCRALLDFLLNKSVLKKLAVLLRNEQMSLKGQTDICYFHYEGRVYAFLDFFYNHVLRLVIGLSVNNRISILFDYALL